jgi:aspartyl/asparaginyl beta-hydroxylase (cupin superfamily)
MPPYQGDEPNYFDSSEFDWAQAVIAHKEEIQTELLQILENRGGNLIPYYSQAVSTDGNQWATLAFKTWGINVYDNLNQAPTVKKLLQDHPNILSASFNILKAGADLAKHSGDTNAIFRCHLGLSIPGQLPEIGFKVNEEEKSWKEGELMIFLDAKEHSGWNHTDGDRLIFLFDVLREEYAQHEYDVCINVRSFLLLQWLGGKFSPFLKLPKVIHRIVFWLFKYLLIIIHPFQQKRGVIIKHT